MKNYLWAMHTAKEIRTLIALEFAAERRTMHSLGGILVYLISSVFILYTAFLFIADPEVWNALLWLIILFVSVNASAKSFLQEPEGRWLYLYQLMSPRSLIIGRTVYNGLVLALLSLAVSALFMLLLGNPLEDSVLFLATLFLGSFGLSAIFSLMAAIASRAGQNATLMAILGFPVVLPLLVTVMKLSGACLEGSPESNTMTLLLSLLLLDALILTLSVVLFPYLWTE